LAAILFWLFLTWDALLARNALQVVSINAHNFGLFSYSIIQIIQLANDMSFAGSELEDPSVANDSGSFFTNQITITVVIGINALTFIYLTNRLNAELSWSMYRSTGGDKVLTKVFICYHILLLLFKYSVFFVIGFIAIDVRTQYSLSQVLTQVTTNGLIEIPFVCVTVGIFVTCLGYYGVRHESRPALVIYILGCAGMFAFILERICSAFVRGGNGFQRAKMPFMLYAVLSELILIACVVYGCVCLRNFGKGLLQVLGQEGVRLNGQSQERAIDLNA
ncbi:hypothetical protein BC830DRAFT_1073219, partial [Chytriomyces sp. MP71]